jgi:hypothetical protein
MRDIRCLSNAIRLGGSKDHADETPSIELLRQKQPAGMTETISPWRAGGLVARDMPIT